MFLSGTFCKGRAKTIPSITAYPVDYNDQGDTRVNQLVWNERNRYRLCGWSLHEYVNSNGCGSSYWLGAGQCCKSFLEPLIERMPLLRNTACGQVVIRAVVSR